MPANLSVKLNEATHQRLKALAATEGVSPHALMVQAIDQELARIEERQGFMTQARQALANAQTGGPVYDGPAYTAYLREQVRARMEGRKPAVRKPKPSTLPTHAKQTKARA
ncbi:MAG: CopG family ribbon-helix-helix protein [Gammaproteobacteria bacterium]